jgi:flagellar hook assembly protein FlgD
MVQVAIYDAMGREVNVLTSGNFEAGHHETNWDGFDKNGKRVTAGVYIYSVKSDRGVVTGRVSVR